jgi:hypothetical protein
LSKIGHAAFNCEHAAHFFAISSAKNVTRLRIWAGGCLRPKEIVSLKRSRQSDECTLFMPCLPTKTDPMKATAFCMIIALGVGGATLSAARADSSELDRLAEDLLDRDTRDAIDSFLLLVQPLIEKFQVLVDDLPQYEPPEILPNGDIIIRRKPPSPENGAESGDPDTIEL